MELQTLLRFTVLFASISTLAACSSAETGSATPVTINGSSFASHVNGANITVKDSAGKTIAGPVTTNADGSYSIDLLDTDLASDLVFESTGGVFDDEATGTVGVQAGAMSAYVIGGTLTSGDSVHMTPGTTITANLITKHGITPSQAKTDFFTAFAYNPDISVHPVDVTDAAALTADDVSRHIGWRAAVFSKLAMDLGLQPYEQFDMFEALAQDLSDSALNGIDASGVVDIGTTGSTLPDTIDDAYMAATGSYTTADSASYHVTYTPPMMNVHGKNQFTLTVADNNGPVTGLSDIKVMPMMYMADMMHTTPTGGITELGNGEYQATAYYLMPSRMMDGTTMGTWDLKVMIGMESVHFYPNIAMAMMNNTARVQLKGVTDTIIDMNGLEVPRTYNLFKDQLTLSGGGNDQLDIFIAPMETMMSFPALVDQMTLKSGMGGTDYLVDGISIDVKVGNGPWQIANGTPNGTGIWSLNGLNLSGGASTDIHVRLTVSNEVKTTNGLDAVADDNDFATFTVTP